MEKIKRVKVSTEKGDRYLVFRPVTDKDVENVCLEVCPYGEKICTALRDPRDPENPKRKFTDFCGNLGILEDDEDNDKTLKDYVPVRGTLEQALPDFDSIYQTIIKDNGYVRVQEVIDSACDGFCPLYKEDHSECSPKNTGCFLRGLLKNCNYKAEDDGGEDVHTT
jgi:hypothetical protein